MVRLNLPHWQLDIRLMQEPHQPPKRLFIHGQGARSQPALSLLVTQVPQHVVIQWPQGRRNRAALRIIRI
jgi:hypothetical protein